MSQSSLRVSCFTWDNPGHNPGQYGLLSREMKEHQRENSKQDRKRNQQMKLGPQSSMNLLDDYPQRGAPLPTPPHLCHLEPLTLPPASGSLRIGGPGMQKRKSVSLQGVFPNSLLSIQMGGPAGSRVGVYASAIDWRKAVTIPWVGRCPQRLGDADQLLGELSKSKQVTWGLNLHSATCGHTITSHHPSQDGDRRSQGTPRGKGP